VRYWLSLIMVGLLVGLIGVTEADGYPNQEPAVLARPAAEFQHSIVTKSKYQIVAEVNRTINEIHRLEKTLGKIGPQGYKVYTAKDTKQLFTRYQILSLLLNYLNRGDFKIDVSQWEGYSFIAKDSKPYKTAQIVRVMDELADSKAPRAFVADLKIFLLPYRIPGVSGLGGNGYIFLGAQAAAEDLIADQLAVTLYHEIGHHINFNFMPKGTVQGDKLWTIFLSLRGGTWHGPGSVNTKAWSESSEETFAEDFRMLFGKNQPFFGDLTLGDPRADWHRAEKEKQFIQSLATMKTENYYHSPWITEPGLRFWQLQRQLLTGLWIFVGAGIMAVNGLENRRRFKPDTHFNV
jgi:hypothetical protein